MKFATLTRGAIVFPDFFELPERGDLRKIFSLAWILLRAENEPLQKIEHHAKNIRSQNEYDRLIAKSSDDITAAIEYLSIVGRNNPLQVYADDIIRLVEEYDYMCHEGKFRITDSTARTRTIEHHPFRCTVYGSRFDGNAVSFTFFINEINIPYVVGDALGLHKSVSSCYLSCELKPEERGYECDVFALLSSVQPIIGQPIDARQATQFLLRGFESKGDTLPSVVWGFFDMEFYYGFGIEICHGVLSSVDDMKLFLAPKNGKNRVYRPTLRIVFKKISSVSKTEALYTYGPFVGSEKTYIGTLLTDIIDSLNSYRSF